MPLKITKFILFSCVFVMMFSQCMTKSKVAQAERKKEKVELEQQRKYEKARKEFKEKHYERQTPEVRKRMKEREREAKRRMRKRNRQEFWERLFGKFKAKN